jgi:RNA polymerase-binding transcription factor DksA
VLTSDFLKDRQKHLIARRNQKLEILNSDGDQAKVHSLSDITRIDFALKRMDEGEYGLCAHCGGLIVKERLLIIPETPFCAFCAKDIETS